MPLRNALHLVEVAPADLDRIMDLERQGFAAGHREERAVYAQRIAAFPQGSLMAWRGEDCVGCVFSEIWTDAANLSAEQFTLGHDIRERHNPNHGKALYISSMTLAPAVRGQGLGTPLLLGCLAHVAQAFPRLKTAVLLVNAAWAPARRIYAGVGFVEVACFTGFFDAGDGVRQDGIVMRKPIT
jgi:ribosomal protein S18 acetylase RimI-like enzyme